MVNQSPANAIYMIRFESGVRIYYPQGTAASKVVHDYHFYKQTTELTVFNRGKDGDWQQTTIDKL